MAKPNEKEWTLMFYFASDNPLAPGIVSQLKSIKQAGFHHEVNVIAQFDPHPVGTPTHIFDVNLINKLKKPDEPQIGFVGFTPNDPFVNSLLEDKLWRSDKTDRHGNPIREQFKKSLGNLAYDPPEPPKERAVVKTVTEGKPQEPGAAESRRTLQEPDPRESLESFLNFCCDNYPARHYMLFILGHGLIVGNDVFLFDEHADEHSLSLKELGTLLSDFKQRIEKEARFELVSFHSCSVSALEVAYQLKGTANYMLASQGPAFVGSWPYRQILIRVFNDINYLIEQGREIKVEEMEKKIKEMLLKIFYYCLHNSTDFVIAGYSFDLCLCNLNNVTNIKEPLETLSNALVEGLTDPLVANLILLSHLKSQSYWQESYTDLYDFCFCLRDHFEAFKGRAGQMTKIMQDIQTAADKVRDQLVKETSVDDDKLIVGSEFAGPEYQYSHGLSVLFPWTQPSDDSGILTKYREYEFSKEIPWVKFLETYFKETMRDPSKEEVDDKRAALPAQSKKDELREDMLSLVFNDEGQLSTTNEFVLKVNPQDRTGDDCTCPSIKNYPHDTRRRSERRQQAGKDEQVIPVSETFFQGF